MPDVASRALVRSILISKLALKVYLHALIVWCAIAGYGWFGASVGARIGGCVVGAIATPIMPVVMAFVDRSRIIEFVLLVWFAPWALRALRELLCRRYVSVRTTRDGCFAWQASDELDALDKIS